MLCTQCNTDNPETNRFCGNCGAMLELAPATPEAKSRPVAAPMDLRDPTDPGHIIVPANGRNVTHAPGEEPLTTTSEAVPVGAEPDAHEVGPELQDAVAYRADENVAAEPADRAHAEDVSHRDVLQPAARSPRRNMSISGPSLLGLNDDESSETSSDGDTGPTDYSYLYEDEGSRRGVNWRLMLALVILIGFGGVLAYMWSQGKNWNTTIIKGIAGGDQKKEAPMVAKTEPTTPGAPEIAVGQTQKPIPADTPQSDKDAKDDSGKKPADAANAPSDQKSAKSADKSESPDNAKGADSAAESKTSSTDTSNGSDAAAVAAHDKNAKDKNANDAAAKDTSATSKDKSATGTADNMNSKQAKATTPDIGDEEDTEPPATAKSAKATKGKASAARASSTDEADDTALVHRADALLRSRNCTEAVDLFREAALHGNATARSRLGGLYATGHCVPLDRAEAYNWFTLAKDAGAHYSWIDHNRNMLWAQMTDRERERVMRR